MLEAFGYLWDWTLSAIRGMTPGGTRLSWADLNAWAVRFDIALAPWESDAIMRTANAYFDAAFPPKA